jgi:hypothetical protein
MFLNPLLLFGLAGIAVPILINLLNRFRHREIDWAAMALLRRALVVRSRQVRIEDILILLLRCLAIALLALAMARPTLRASGLFGRDAEMGAVIALDGSFSMAHKPGVHSRFRRAVDRVRDVLKTVQPGSPVSLVLLGSRPRVLVPPVGYDKKRFDRVLADLEPLPERLNLEVCLEELEGLIRDIKAPARECYLVTDAQAGTWGDLSDQARLALDKIGRAATLFFVTTPATSVENVGLSHFALRGGSLRKGAMARYTAEVQNFGRQPQERLAVTLFVNDLPVDQRSVDRLAPGEAATVPLFARFDRTGDLRLSARLGHDPLETDNRRHAVAHVHERLRVLCVDGDPSPDPFGGETAYLAAALAPKRAETLDVKTVSWLELPGQRLGDYQVVILANVPDIRATQVRALSAFVRRGGGLMVFLGDKSVPRLLNARLRAGDDALLPGQIGEPKKAEDDGWPVSPTASGHLLSRALEGLPRELLGRATVEQCFAVRPGKGSRVALALAGADLPFLLEKPLGRGSVLLFASTADRAWSDFVVHPAGPILLNQAVTYLTRQPQERQVLVGEPLVMPLPEREVVQNVVFRDPRGEATPVQPTQRDGQQVAESPATDQAGFYEIQRNGLPLAAAVNVDPLESDVAGLYGTALTKALSGLPVRVLAPTDDAAAAIRQGRVGLELWRPLMLLALIVLLLEQVLAHRFSRRMAIREDVLGAETPEQLLAEDREQATAA